MFKNYFNIEQDKKELISFVGGGGKTSSIFKLAHELKNENKKVLVTTTTKIFVPEPKDFNELIISHQNRDLNKIRPLKGSITVWGEGIQDEKILGIPLDFIDEIFRSGLFDYILVEADGAQRKPIKAPASYEPVIPSSTSKMVGVIGLSALHKDIEKEVFRTEIFRKLCGDSKILTLDQIFRLIIASEGLFKNTPFGCEKYLFLNQVEDENLKKAAQEIVNMLNGAGFNLDGVIIGSLKKEKFYPCLHRQYISGIIMAAGFSRRMGQDKLLLRLNNGLFLVEKVIKEAVSSDLNEIILIYQNPDVQKIGEKYGVKTVFNPEPFKGQSASVKIGVKASHSKTDGYMFLPADMPFIDNELINKVVAAFKSSTFPIVIPFYNNMPGMPAIFSAALGSKLLNLTGDEGGRSIIRQNPEHVKKININETFKGIDIDTQEEVEKYLNH